jgi:hypothetical protein
MPEAGRKPIKRKWVFTLKYNEAGEIEKFKARLVAMGYSQRPGVDYGETYAEVPRMESLMAFLAMVATEDLELLQADVKTAFLNGDLEEELYMTQPPGFAVGSATLICKLKKSLYGLKQAPRAWREKRNEIMERLGFKPALADTCIYIKVTRHGKTIVFFYVDDVLVAARILHMAEQALWEMAKLVDIRLMGEPVRFLGREIKRNRAEKTLLVTQKAFTEELLNRCGMAEVLRENRTLWKNLEYCGTSRMFVKVLDLSKVICTKGIA